MNCWSRTAGPSISPRCPDRPRMWMGLMLNVISCLVDVGRGKVKISRSSPASTLSGVGIHLLEFEFVGIAAIDPHEDNSLPP